MRPRQATCFQQFHQALSPARLAPYGYGSAPPDLVCGRYLWNTALSESLYTTLNFFEVALRNAIHDDATRHFKSPMWYDTATRWNGSPLWEKIQRDQLAAAKKSLPASFTSDDLVAKLTFGFWTGVFNQKYEFSLAVHVMKRVFPNMPRAARRRALVAPRLDAVRDLRNRVFHHEPIWQRNLAAEHREILTLLEGVNYTAYAAAIMVDNFPTIWHAGVAPYQQRYLAWVGTLRP